MTKITREVSINTIAKCFNHIDPDREPDDESIEFIMHRLEDENGEVQANKITL